VVPSPTAAGAPSSSSWLLPFCFLLLVSAHDAENTSRDALFNASLVYGLSIIWLDYDSIVIVE